MLGSKLRKLFMCLLMRILGVRKLYDEVAEKDREENLRSVLRKDIEQLLGRVNENNSHFRGKYTSFLASIKDESDDKFFEQYAELPYFTKQDFAEAGFDVMRDDYDGNNEQMELKFSSSPLKVLWRLCSRDFILPMATGGSTSLPLAVYMNKYHAFSMLFTFFKCWRKMGWDLGDKILVFYPRNTYNIDEMSRFNKYSWLSGFRIVLFDRIDEPTIRELVDELNTYRPKMFLVFPSPMNMIADAIRKHDMPLGHQPELINTSGETFFDCQRKNIQSVFTESKIEDSYGSVELGEIAHQTDDGLEIFSNVAYVENRETEDGVNEMIITRLDLDVFPFIRYQMKDLAEVEFRDRNGKQSYVMRDIEGKDTNFILSHNSERLYPSFFNRFVSELNEQVDNEIVEIKVYERGRQELEVQFITRNDNRQDDIQQAALSLLRERIGSEMNYEIRFVDFIDHDYRKKYRVIERQGDVEYAGGIVGNDDKLARIDAGSAHSHDVTRASSSNLQACTKNSPER